MFHRFFFNSNLIQTSNYYCFVLISAQELKMMSKWVIGVALMSLLVLSVASYSYNNAQQQQYPSYPSYPAPPAYKTCPAIGGQQSKCRPAKDCSVWYDLVVAIPDADCKLSDGNPGICCPDLPYNGIPTYCHSSPKHSGMISNVELMCINIPILYRQWITHPKKNKSCALYL